MERKNKDITQTVGSFKRQFPMCNNGQPPSTYTSNYSSLIKYLGEISSYPIYVGVCCITVEFVARKILKDILYPIYGKGITYEINHNLDIIFWRTQK